MQSLKPIETLKQVLVLLIKIESWVVKGTIQKVSTLNSSTRENKKVRTFWTTIHKFHILHVTQKRHSKLHHSFTSMISASWSMMCSKLITQDLMPMKQDNGSLHPLELQFVPGKILHYLLTTEICYKYQSGRVHRLRSSTEKKFDFVE